jgi:HEAT repeats
MRMAGWMFAVAVLIGIAGPAPAGFGIFSRKAKIDPAEHVPALIMQLKTDKDEAKRSAAAEELRNFDPKAFPEMMTVLADAILKDASAAVRSESASTIAKLRPINQQAGYALEQAAANDPSMRVRMAARQSLWQYNLLGYRSVKPPAETVAAGNPPVAPMPTKPYVSAKARGGKESPEPPLADATNLQPVTPPRLLTPPSGKQTPVKPATTNTPDAQGPALGAPG